MTFVSRLVAARVSALVLAGASVIAQTITATLGGSVHDSSDASVPNAQVSVVNLSTNVAMKASTSIYGRFVVPALPAGSYSLSVEATGFKRFKRTGIVLEVNQQAEIDVRLEVGQLSETVEVSSETPLLESTSSAVGQVINNKSIINLPLNQRNSYALVFLAPGVTGNVDFEFNSVNISINGGRPGSNEILVDGIPSSPPLVNPIQGYTVFPSVDAVQEFKVQTDSYSAEFGRSGGGIINFVYKSGGNRFHGSLFEFLRNSVLDSNAFFANRSGIALGSFKRNQFGGALGGPVLIPKLYNGRNKTFFYFTYEGLRQRAANNTLASVPTELQRGGDFSQTFSGPNKLITIYDPVTTTPSGSGFTRLPFPGNIIPVIRIDPVAANIIKYYPHATSTGDAATGLNNFASAGTAPTDSNQIDLKVDENIDGRNRFFLRYSHRNLNRPAPLVFPSAVQAAQTGLNQPQISNNAAADYTWTATSTFLVDVRLGFGRTLLNFTPLSDGFDPAQLGLPAYIRDNADRLMFPGVQASSYISLGTSGSSYRHNGFETYSLSVNNTKILDRHVLKFGWEGRLIRVNNTEAGSADGSFNFNKSFTQGPNPNAASATAGNSIASLLLGLGNGTMTQGFKGVSTVGNYFGWYFADDWKITSRLTLNLGLRYELELPREERYNRVNVFDPLAPSPLAGPAGLPNLTGGLEFAGVDGRSSRQFPTDTNNWAPRLGFAYQATKTTVVRGGAGVFYAPSLRAAGGTVGNFGYRSDTNFVSAPDGITPVDYLRNPFPTGLVPKPGNTQGLLTGVGSQISASVAGDGVTPYSLNWSFNVQQQLPGNFLIEAAYVGNHGVHLSKSGEADYDLNQLRPDQIALGSKLQQSVPNPFFALITTGPLAAKTVPYSFLLRPYPQFLNVYDLYQTGASSIYHSFQLKVEKRMSKGLSLLASFTGAKQIDDYSIISNVGRNVGLQNIYNMAGERAVSGNDVSKRLVVSAIYELPFGRGRKLGANWNRLVDAMLGGWQMNGLASFQTGFPLGITTQNTSGSGSNTLRPNNNGQSAALDGSIESRLSRYFNTSVFSQPAPFTFGDTGRTLPDVRGPGVRNLDFSVFKNFTIREGISLQFRAESFNLMNTPQFGLPNQNFNATQFGQISSQANTPRQIQFGLKLLF